MIRVVDAKYVEGYVIRVRFDNGESGEVDLRDALWGPVFEPLRDLSAFRQFELSEVFHTVSWRNGADFAPEFLYEKMLEQTRAAGAAAR